MTLETELILWEIRRWFGLLIGSVWVMDLDGKPVNTSTIFFDFAPIVVIVACTLLAHKKADKLTKSLENPS